MIAGIKLRDETGEEDSRPSSSNLQLASGVSVAYDLPVSSAEQDARQVVAESEMSLDELMAQMKSI